jgi:hypothetical protein
MAERAEADARAGLPAWSLPAGAVDGIAISADWPERVTRAWAWGDSRGAGIRIALVDSGTVATASGRTSTRSFRARYRSLLRGTGVNREAGCPA